MALDLSSVSCNYSSFLSQINRRMFDSVSYIGDNQFLCWVVSSVNYYVITDFKEIAEIVDRVDNACTKVGISFADLTKIKINPPS